MSKIIEYLKKNYIVALLIFISVIALFLRYTLIEFKTYDFNHFLNPWFDALKDGGGFNGIKSYTGDYNYPYVTILSLLTYLPISPLYSIKFLSIICDFAMAIVAVLIIKEIFKDKNIKKPIYILTYGIIIFLPTVVLNSAMWSQCDVIYTLFCLLSLLFLLKKKIFHTFIFLGLAFAFKLQFIFIMPLFGILYLTDKKQNISLKHFFIIPLVNILLCFPALFSGVSFSKIAMVYFNQTQTYSHSLTHNFPNVYALFEKIPPTISLHLIIITAIVFGILLLWLLIKKVKWSNEMIMNVALLSVMLATYLLPGMHDRYLYLGDVLSVICFICYRQNIFIPLIINFVSLSTYASYLSSGNLTSNYQIISLFFFLAIIMQLKYLNKLIKKQK